MEKLKVLIVDDEPEPLKAWVGKVFRELTDSEVMMIDAGKLSLKTNGMCENVLIAHPDAIALDGHRFKRRGRTNVTPKKKRRKNRKQ